MHDDERDPQLNETTTADEEQTPQQATAIRMLANPRRIRRN
ncbi:hypothetical protein O2W15_07455 [Modestobacter sp. VKM Ac-2979]|nr:MULTISPECIES: hypothetical protein [unclassified Modestobacter]MCZ2811273.1 hypothetical protein [Modestobacter sp. VKM Ac-2979]MCZ2840786.1 hypothetical protein [Modestobacter sp. VKM Ac-2980]